jgi:hypothetical protein
MDKIIYQDSNEEFMNAVAANGEAMVNLIELESGVKSAASQLINKSLLEEYRPTDDSKVLIHLIGMGNSDQYGFNRNGDWFSGDVLEKRAHTFVTHGKMYREHANKDPKKSIGEIKYAAYDPKGMQRVEILVHMDKDKAEEEYEMAKQGSALNFSMSCRVPNDRCSCCGNEAKTIANYCDCLKNHMGQYMDGFNKYAFAYNDEPTFFDISRVKNPADRIARHLEYMFANGGEVEKAASHMCKAASADSDVCVPGAVAAMLEGVNLGNNIALDEHLVLSKLASAEEYIADVRNANNFYTDERANACYGSYPFSMLEKLASDELDLVRSVNPGTLFGEMAKRACVLSFPAFCQYVSGDVNAPESPLCKKAALVLPSIFRDMMSTMMPFPSMMSEFCGSSDRACCNDPKHADLVQNFMDKAEDKFSIEAEPVKQRVLTIVIKIAMPGAVEDKFQKAASYNVSYKDAAALANAYGQYQVRALCDIRDRKGADFINDNTYDMIAGANSVLVFDRD